MTCRLVIEPLVMPVYLSSDKHLYIKYDLLGATFKMIKCLV